MMVLMYVKMLSSYTYRLMFALSNVSVCAQQGLLGIMSMCVFPIDRSKNHRKDSHKHNKKHTQQFFDLVAKQNACNPKQAHGAQALGISQFANSVFRLHVKHYSSTTPWVV